jgi:outer membrane usher protein
MARSRRAPFSELLISLGLIAAMGLEAPLLAQPAEQSLALQLEVKMAGTSTDIIAGFERLADGRLAARRHDLTALGLPVPESDDPEETVILDEVPRLRYSYDEAAQSVDIWIVRDQSDPNRYVLRDKQERPAPESIPGMFVNYSLYGSLAGEIESTRFTGASALLDARGFSTYGTLAQSQILGTTPDSDHDFTRLDTTYSYSSMDHAATINAGDFITGALNWTGAIRMAGLQLKRDFATRPDLITAPLPSFRGSAAVPSTLEVFIDNVKRYSNEVPEGAFEIIDIPTYSRNGVARIVLRDAQGRETVAEQPIHASPNLLRPGLNDYSLEAGFPRRNQGSRSFDYHSGPAASASLRRGLSQGLTVEGHAETMRGLLNAGAGAVMSAGGLGTLSAATAASLNRGTAGAQLQAGWEFSMGNFHLGASARRVFGPYADLGIASAEDESESTSLSSFEQISLGFGFPEWDSHLSAGFMHTESRDGSDSAILTANFGKQLAYDVSFSAGGYIDLKDRQNVGASLSLHVPLGKNYAASTGLNVSKDYAQPSASITRSSKNVPGSLGWRVNYSDGGIRRASASANYVTGHNDLMGVVQATEGSASGNITATGSLVMADGDVFLARRIGEAFAIVDAGHPGVPVLSQNRPVGRTGNNGKILIPDVVPYHKNKIEIETGELPIDAEVLQTETHTVVARNSGSVVKLNVATSISAAVVVFKLGDGSFVPAGSAITLNGGHEPFIAGYDGQAYLTGLKLENSAVVQHAEGTCRASFTYAPQAGAQVFIDGVLCR